MVKSRKHVLLVAFPAFGHIIPLLEFGKKIVKQHDVTFTVSACMLEKIWKRELVSKSDFPVVGIEDGHRDFEMSTDDASDKAELDSIRNHMIPGTRKFLTEIPAADKRTPAHGVVDPVDVVIADNILAAPLTVCHDRGIPYHFFNTASISMTLSALMMTDDTPTLPDTNENNMGFMDATEPGSKSGPVAVWMKDMILPMHKTMHLVSGIVVNSVRDLELDLMELMQEYPVMENVPIRFVGPLVPENERINKSNQEQQAQVTKWLDQQATQSVIYISFGSIAFPVPEQLTEIMSALQQLKKPFIFSLAASQHQYLPQEIVRKIATQFEEGNSLILPWTPQKLILQHPATAVFLSHCGWNSTMESVFSGMPVVAWPMFADQKANAQFLANRGMGVLIEGTGVKNFRIVPAEEIAETLAQVAWSGTGTRTSYREAAVRWKNTVIKTSGPGGSSAVELRELLATF